MRLYWKLWELSSLITLPIRHDGFVTWGDTSSLTTSRMAYRVLKSPIHLECQLLTFPLRSLPRIPWTYISPLGILVSLINSHLFNIVTWHGILFGSISRCHHVNWQKIRWERQESKVSLLLKRAVKNLRLVWKYGAYSCYMDVDSLYYRGL